MEETEYGRIKVGNKSLEDAILNLESLSKALPTHGYTKKKTIYKAMSENNLVEMRNISNFYYNLNGIYQRICNYAAYLYRYDWYLVPEINDNTVKEEKMLADFSRILNFLDNSYIRKTCGDIALDVIKEGAYYGYIIPNATGLVLQQLPIGYCRSRYKVGNKPAIEFNMKFFDTFRDPAYRLKVLNLFPKEFQKGYILYKQGKLSNDSGLEGYNSWYLLDIDSTVKFNINENDMPLFFSSIPALLDLDAAQDLDRRRQMQKLNKILVQKLPMDKNGDLIFDMDEARDIHNNAVKMLSNAIGTDVITTFAEIEPVDLSDKSTSATMDELERVERAAYNNFGISENLFNTSGNMSLEKSILNDESSLRNLLFQFAMFYDDVTRSLNTNKKKYNFKLYMLETTQYNYKELAKLYKEQTQIGYSKMLPQIALGHSQSFILNSIHFENEILHLSEIMIPPLMSSTLSGEDVLKGKKGNVTEEKASGRPEKPNDQKSDKTIQNIESQG